MNKNKLNSSAEKYCLKALKAMLNQMTVRNKKLASFSLYPDKKLERQAKKWFNIAEHNLKRAREVSKNQFIFPEFIQRISRKA